MLNFPALDFHHGETIDMLRSTVQAFAAAEIAPRAADIDRLNQFPADLWRKMGDLGLLGITVEDEDLNGHAHCQHLLMGASESIPCADGEMLLGRWQRVFLVELDCPREREVIVQIVGS